MQFKNYLLVDDLLFRHKFVLDDKPNAFILHRSTQQYEPDYDDLPM